MRKICCYYSLSVLILLASLAVGYSQQKNASPSKYIEITNMLDSFDDDEAMILQIMHLK